MKRKPWTRKKVQKTPTPKIVQRLADGLLIAKEEKVKMEGLQPTEMKAKIYDLISKSELKVAAKIFLAIRSVETEQEAKKHCKQKPLKNPMEINTVIRNLFRFLNVEDLKACRNVCQKWNTEAEPLLRKNAAITFGLSDFENSITELRHPVNFLETFRHFSESTTNLPFTSFRFSEDVEWRVSDLVNFIDQQKNNIKDLQLCGVTIQNENEDTDEDGSWKDISDWFADLSVPKLTIICCDKEWYNDTTIFQFSLSILTCTTHIKLDNCVLKIGNEMPIAPIAIDIMDLKLLKDGNFLREFCINDLIDFSKAKDIRITSYDDEHQFGTILRLDFRKCLGLSANYISLNGIKIDNWKDSKVVTKTLVLKNVPFLEKNEMEIKELHIRDNSKIDLFALPLSIEKIHIDTQVERNTISCSDEVELPNLQFLKVQNSEHFPDYFEYCPNLRNIEIYVADSAVNDVLNLNWIPKCVKRIKLEGVKDIKEYMCYTSELDRLVLENYSLLTAAKFLDKIKPNVLVLQWKRGFEMNGSVLLFLQEFKDLVLFIGPFIWDDPINAFETSPLLTHVDKKSDYYVFDNNQGRSILRQVFENMKNLDKN